MLWSFSPPLLTARAHARVEAHAHVEHTELMHASVPRRVHKGNYAMTNVWDRVVHAQRLRAENAQVEQAKTLSHISTMYGTYEQS